MRIAYMRLILVLIERDGDMCALCGHTLERGMVNIDHIVPESHGGTRALDNLRVVHKHCNASRGDRDCPMCRDLELPCNLMDAAKKRALRLRRPGWVVSTK
jgi:hypothetical protein